MPLTLSLLPAAAMVVAAAWILARWFRLGPRTDIAGRWVAITGCDSGFGRGVVEALVAREARVIACCYTAARPQRRYLSGTLAKTLFYGLWTMPEAWSHRFKRTLIRPLPPAVAPAPRRGPPPR
jgi:hypothetical protein